MKTEDGLKTIMSIMAEEEKSNSALVAALQPSAPLNNTVNITEGKNATNKFLCRCHFLCQKKT